MKKDSQKQMPKIDFSKKGENTYFKTHNRLFFGYFFNRRPIWEPLVNALVAFQKYQCQYLQELSRIYPPVFMNSVDKV